MYYIPHANNRQLILKDMTRSIVSSMLVACTLMPLCALAQVQWEPRPVELNEELAERVRFGYLAVPENRANPDSREIFMAFTVLKSLAENPLPDPVIILPEGPGIGLSQFVSGIAGNAVVQKILQRRDVILIDIRGTGYSHPRLCDHKNTEEYRLRSAFSHGAELDMLNDQIMAKCAENCWMLPIYLISNENGNNDENVFNHPAHPSCPRQDASA